MDYIYGNINNNLVTINRLEYVELRKCKIANQPIEGLNVGDFYLAFKVFDCKKLIYCSLAEMNQDIIDELNKKLAGKVDKIEKTNSWRVYGVGSKELDLPNGDSIDVSDQSIPNTLINRNANGTAQINNPVDAKDIANKQYIDGIKTDLDTKLDTKLDKEYIVLTNTVIAYGEKINNDDAIILTNLYNKYEGITPEIPLFVRDKNNNIALLSFYHPHGLRFQVISNNSDEYFPIVSWQIGTTKSFIGDGKYYLHNILGQNAWEKSVTAYIGIDSDYKLVLANNNKIITGQNDRSVVVPPFTYTSFDTFTLGSNLTITGNLSVSGTTTTVDTETLKVKDNVIVTNSDKNELIDLSGLAINTDETNTFGIMYDPTSNTVDLGLGTITTEGKFTFNENEGLPLAIRDRNSSFTQDHLISWSTDKNKLVDSGIDKSVIDTKLDKVAKTDSWQVYGEGTDGAKLPYNNGRTIKASEKPEKYTLMNRGENGNCQVEKPINDKDIANKVYVDNSLKNYTPLSSYNESLTDIANIKKVIPNQANENNQLADKNFVNSTINSNTAFFIGNFNTYADLETWQNQNPSKATNNDYAYINSDENHNGEAWRYQYVKTDNEVVGIWKAQFKVNDTPLTSEQLAAINSGITKETINDINSKIPTDINAKSQFFYADLILEHNGQEIAGQKKLAKIPAWRLIDDADYPIPVKTFMKSQFINIVNLGINNDIFFPSLSESILFCKRDKDTNAWVGFDVDTTVKTTGTTGIQILLTDANVKTINGESIYGTGNIDLNEYVDAKLDTKVDKVEKTNRWQLYGVGDKTNDLPNGGTINAESNAAPYTVINRDGSGRAKIQNPVNNLDITNKQYVDGNFERKTVLSNVLPTNNILLDLHNYQLESPITSDFSFIMPTDASDEYLSEISFTTGPTLVAFTTTSAITFTGEDCSNTHTFVPDTNKHYNIIFWKDKAGFQAVVRGY